jgi:hypothetical protein
MQGGGPVKDITATWRHCHQAGVRCGVCRLNTPCNPSSSSLSSKQGAPHVTPLLLRRPMGRYKKCMFLQKLPATLLKSRQDGTLCQSPCTHTSTHPSRRHPPAGYPQRCTPTATCCCSNIDTPTRSASSRMTQRETHPHSANSGRQPGMHKPTVYVWLPVM